MRLKQINLITTALASVMLVSPAIALAQATSPDDVATSSGTGSNKVSEVVVTGIRGSIQKSLDIKKRSDAVVEVISAEAIGKFPDTNLAESLAHLPGVSVDRQFGEGDRVSIDGTDPALNRVFIDGHAIASADWGGDPQDTSSRNFNYSYISPDIISQLELYKNPEAWIDEGSVGGTTIVKTRKPLDLDANTIFASGGYKYNDRSAQGDVAASLAYSWKTDDDKFGIIGAYTHNEEHLTRSGIEYFGYSNGSDFLAKDSSGAITGVANPGMTINGAAPTAASEALVNAARYPAFISADYFQQDRVRDGFQGDVSWRPLPTLQFDLSALYIGGSYNNLSQAAYSYDVRTSRATAITVANGLIDSATYNSAPATGPGSSDWNGELDENYRKTAISNQTYDLAYRWDVGGFRITGDAGYTRATGGTQPEYLLNWRTQSGFTYKFNGRNTYLNYTTSPSSPNFWQTEYLEAVNDKSGGHMVTVPGYNNGQPFLGFQVGGIGQTEYTDGEVYGKSDFEHDLNFGPFYLVKFGAKYSTHDNSSVTHGDATYAPVSGGAFSLGSLGTSLTPTGVFSGLQQSGNAFQYSTLTASQVVNEINSLPNIHNSLDQDSYFDVQENVEAGYLEGEFKGEKYHGNIGVRIVNTSDRSSFFETSTGTNGDSTTQLVTVNHSYLKALPSFNIAYDLTQKIVFHLGAAEVIARPRYSDLAGSTSVSVPITGAIGTAGGGNPNLKPYDSYNGEATVEWYFKKNSLLSAEFFYRDVQNYTLNITGTDPVTLTNGVTGQTGQYYLTGPINAGKAKVGGLALTGTWDIGWGFGIQSNVTYSEAKTNDGYNLPFLSKYVANIIPYYERGPFQARVSYNYRTDYFTDIGRLNSSDFTAAYTELDTQLSWHFTKKISLVFNASNLLDETYFSYSGTKAAPTALYKNGRVFALNFSFRQ